MSDPKNPSAGDLAIDATELAGQLVDLPNGAMVGKRRAQDGFDEACEELLANQPSLGNTAGILTADLDNLQQITARMAQIQRFVNPVGKLLELLLESLAHYDEERHRIISICASAVDRRMVDPGKESLEAAYERTRTYRSAVGVKAAKTRAKREAEEKAAKEAADKAAKEAAASTSAASTSDSTP